MKKFALLHPFIFLAASLLYSYRGAAVIASPDQIIRPLLALTVLLLLLEFPARWIARDWDGAALLLLIFVLGFCSVSRFFLAAGLASLVVLVPAYLFARLRKVRFGIAHMNGALSIVALALLAVFGAALWTLLPARIKALEKTSSLPADLRVVSPSPDIYYLVLDGYARADILQNLYLYDNGEFIQGLRARGFIVPEHNHSNYPKTALSVTSTLNMDYVEAFAPGITDEPYWWLMSPHIDHSRVHALLEDVGYTSVTLASDWGITDNPTADVYVSPSTVVLNDYENFLLFRTPLGSVRSLLAKFAYVQSYDSHRDLIRFQFKSLASLPKTSRPKFVFAHIVAPHPPFVFDAPGNPVQPAYPFSFNDASDFPYSADEYRAGYIDQVSYVNDQLLTAIDAILQESDVPPVIILQADHGPGMFTDFESSVETCLQERFSPFAAYYLPGVDPAAIPDTITPVNLFRIVFNQYFSADFPLLEDKYFFSTGIFLYRQENVTDRVDTCTQQ